MCGIAGIINKNGTSVNSDALFLMTENMKRRGPDDEGFMLFNETTTPYIGTDSILKNHNNIKSAINQQFKVGFGFRQLKIIDLSNNSHQPMCDLNQNYWVILNGEIYNYKEIRNQLISLGHTFFSNSDTEVVLNAYKEWSENALSKFNGMFALAIFDKTKNEVFFARDRIGIKPFYYFQNNDYFIFGSTIKSIVASNLYNAEINWEGLSQNFRFSIAQRPSTSFKDIKALKPAHWMKFNLNTNTLQTKQYWEIPVNNQEFNLTEKQSIGLVEESLYKSIKYRLNADVEVGSFMSGGIDSTTISSIASKINPTIKALTLGFNKYDDFNEINEAKDTAALNNLNHVISYTKPEDILANINQITSIYEEPYFGLPANYILASMASKNNLKVVLNGLGGDELFGGYDVYNKLSLWPNLKKINSILKITPKIHPKIKKAAEISGYKNTNEFYSHYYTNFNDNEISALFNKKNSSTYNTLLDYYNPTNLSFSDDFEALSFYNIKSYIGNHQMRTTDHCLMHFSVEGRFPLLDHNFIETAFKIPTKYKLHKNSQKYILKQVAKKHIAKSCLTMKKKGLTLPLKHWISTDLKEFVNDHIVNLKNRNIFNNLEIDIILKSNNPHKIWQLVSTELWLNKFISTK